MVHVGVACFPKVFSIYSGDCFKLSGMHRLIFFALVCVFDTISIRKEACLAHEKVSGNL